MKKLLVTAAIALVLLGATVPGFMGWETQKQMESLATYIDGVPGYSAKWLNYQRGWFHSHGRMEVSIAQDQLGPDALTLPVDFQLQHGPVLTGSGRWQLGWFDLLVHLTQDDEKYLQELLTVQQSGPIYELTALMALNGTTTLADRWLPAALNLEDATINTLGYNGSGYIGLDRVLHYNGMLQPITIEGDGGSAKLGEVEFEVLAELARATDEYVVPGKLNVGAQSVTLTSDDAELGGQWQLGQFSVAVTTDISDDQRVSSITLFKVADIESKDAPKITDLSLGLTYKRIPLAFIGAYQELAEQAPQDAGPEYWQAALGSIIIEQLLPASPELEIAPITFSTEHGAADISLRVGIDGEALASADVSPLNPLAIMPFVNADVDMTLSQALLEQLVDIYTEQTLREQLAAQDVEMSEQEFAQALAAQRVATLEMLRLQGLLVTQGDNSTLTFTLAKGQATLNGQPLPLPF